MKQLEPDVAALLQPFYRHRILGPTLPPMKIAGDLEGTSRWSCYDVHQAQYHHDEPSKSPANVRVIADHLDKKHQLEKQREQHCRAGGETVLYHVRVMQDLTDLFWATARNQGFRLDRELLLDCARLHDDGEARHAVRNGGNGSDILVFDHGSSIEAEEYYWFQVNRLNPLYQAGHHALVLHYRKAFLLQHVGKWHPSAHPEATANVLEYLAAEKPEEVQAWIDLENLGYVLSAVHTLLCYPDRPQAQRKFVQTLSGLWPQLWHRPGRTLALERFMRNRVWSCQRAVASWRWMKPPKR